MKTKIAFYIESMVVGGAEKVLIDLVNNLDASRFDITVIAIFKKSVYSDYEFQFEHSFAAHIHYQWLVDNGSSFKYKLFNFLYNKLPKTWGYWVLNKGKYDIEVAFYEGFPTDFVSHSTQKTKKIAWLHTMQDQFYQFITESELINKKNIYFYFDHVIGVSQAVTKNFLKYIDHNSIRAFYNPILNNVNLNTDKEKLINTPLKFITVGRLIPIKGFKRLISILGDLVLEGYDFKLNILGGGYLESELREQIIELNLEDRVILMGFVENPIKQISNADCLICSSFIEGFGNTLAEAILTGVPVIATDCGGTAEIIDQKYGVLCSNTDEGLKAGIKSILDNPVILESYQDLIRQDLEVIRDKFSVRPLNTFLSSI